ncbi:MAG: DUF5689 domain-containing protein [Salinivirgaceae bacterium]
MKTLNITLLLALLALFGLTGCIDQDFDEPPFTTLPEGTMLTIDDLYQIYQDSGAYSFQKEAYVFGTITGDEASGNLYKSLYLQDATGAINLHLLSSAGMVLAGDSVRIVLKGLYLSDYRGVMQLDSLNPDVNIVKVANNVPRQPEVVTVPELLSGNYTCKLIKLENVQFIASDTSGTYADGTNQITVNRYLEDCSDPSNKVIVRTSGYANFANDKIPNGNGSIIAIASRYNSDIQLYIRDLNDIDMNGERCGNVVVNPGTGTGTFEDPYDVANGIAKQGETGKWVKGYLVGAYETLDAEGNNLADFAPSFEGPYNTPTNVIIAADAAETDITKCVIVQLPTGDIRNNTNLKENPANEDKEILYFGDLTSYFSSAGLKNTTGYWLDGAGIIPTEPEGFFIENFTTNLGQFSAYSAVGASQVWEWASYGSGCAVMSGYDGSNFANEDWLISPSISLVGKSNVVLNFTHAVNYLDDWNNIKVLASEDYSGTGDPTSATWTEITGWDQTQPGNSWTFFPSGEVAMTAFEGKTIYLAFKYISSTSGGSTWEVGDVSLSEK